LRRSARWQPVRIWERQWRTEANLHWFMGSEEHMNIFLKNREISLREKREKREKKNEKNLMS
jgi:hypothetical protein